MRRGRRTPSDPAGFTPASVGVRSRPFIFFQVAVGSRGGLPYRACAPRIPTCFRQKISQLLSGGGKALTADFSLELLIPKGLSLRRVPNRTRPDSVRASSFARPFRRASASLFLFFMSCGREDWELPGRAANGRRNKNRCSRRERADEMPEGAFFFDKAGWVKAL